MSSFRVPLRVPLNRTGQHYPAFRPAGQVTCTGHGSPVFQRGLAAARPMVGEQAPPQTDARRVPGLTSGADPIRPPRRRPMTTTAVATGGPEVARGAVPPNPPRVCSPGAGSDGFAPRPHQALPVLPVRPSADASLRRVPKARPRPRGTVPSGGGTSQRSSRQQQPAAPKRDAPARPLGGAWERARLPWRLVAWECRVSSGAATLDRRRVTSQEKPASAR